MQLLEYWKDNNRGFSCWFHIVQSFCIHLGLLTWAPTIDKCNSSFPNDSETLSACGLQRLLLYIEDKGPRCHLQSQILVQNYDSHCLQIRWVREEGEEVFCVHMETIHAQGYALKWNLLLQYPELGHLQTEVLFQRFRILRVDLRRLFLAASP